MMHIAKQNSPKNETGLLPEEVGGRHTEGMLEGTGEVALVIEAAALPHLGHRQLRMLGEQLACLFHAQPHDIGLRLVAGDSRKPSAEGGDAHTELLGHGIDTDMPLFYLPLHHGLHLLQELLVGIAQHLVGCTGGAGRLRVVTFIVSRGTAGKADGRQVQ